MPTESSSAHSIERKLFDRPHHFFYVIRIALLCSLFLMNLPLLVAAQTSSWNASNFEVFTIDPWVVVPKQNNSSNPTKPPSVPTFAQIDAYFKKLGPIGIQPAGQFQGSVSITSGHLKEVGNIYGGIGLPEPIFAPIKGSTRGVFLFEFPGLKLPPDTAEGLASYIPGQPCNSLLFKDNWIALNAKTNLTNTFLQYKSIAHELFHGIQHQSEFEKGLCKIDKWIYEGIADAAGFFLLEKKLAEDGLPLPVGNQKDYKKFHGVRPYDVPLHQDASWNKPGVKRRFGPKVGVYNHKEIYDMFGYRTSSFWRYLMDRYDVLPPEKYNPRRLLALSERFMNHAPPNNSPTDWLDWVATQVLHKPYIWGSSFPVVYGQFLAEFAAWPGSKYPNLQIKDVLKKTFGGCVQVTLAKKSKKSKTITLKAHTGTDFALNPVAGRCIQVMVKGFKGKTVKLELEAEVEEIKKMNKLLGKPKTVKSAVDVADQIVLGFSREERKGKLVENCYSLARNRPNDQFPCAYLGKTNPKGENAVRSWRFAKKKVKHPAYTRTFILTNVDPKTPSETKGIETLIVRATLRVWDGNTQKWTRFDPPETFNLGELPDATIPRRQALYGIKKKSAISTGYSMNLGPIQVAARDEAGSKTETYAITPLEPVAFGQTGTFKAMVMVGNQGAQSGLSPRIIGSTYCAADSQPGSIGTITRSDDEILEIAIDTPLCQLPTLNIMACKDGCPVVDHFQGTLSLPFGWRYFAENEVEDLVTPGVLLDIDRYHHEVFGEPLQGLGSNGSGGSGSGSGNNGSGGGTPIGNGGSQSGTVIPPCDCSCEGYEQHKKKLKEIKASKIPDFNILGQMLQCDQQCAKPFRDCRRDLKRR